ncbi:MAG: winged helix-turn-helix domain-containing protein [Puniceicoccales bacterium]|jgi:hypothetical protein|nr:winged helix-turn-helix domain-containing protein [Puniceicoccales bacterium]
MNASEEILEENGEGEFAPVERPGEKASLIGDQRVAPDATLLEDLKSLATLSFGTRWSGGESGSHFSADRPRNPQRRPPMRDHSDEPRRNYRPPQSSERESDAHKREERPFRESRGPRFDDRRRDRVPLPPFEVRFYQEDRSFDLLLDEMRKNCKTYELFTVARLILQKPERFVAVVRRRPDREGVIAPLYLSLLDDLVFESEQEAMAYIIQRHVEEFFDVEEQAVEAPKGRFTCVHRCGLTKKLLSAPNYHRYRSILREHFDGEITAMPFERFLTKIETTKEESDIQNWLQQMSRRVIYTPKAIDETVTDLAPIESLSGVKNYLLRHYRDRIMREVTAIRVMGGVCEGMPSRAIARAIQFFLQRQRQFPFDTASNLRHRFRRAGFGIYRKGKEKILYVCAVKRKFRRAGDIFEPTIQALITFLEPLEKITLQAIKRDYIDANGLSEKEVWDGLNWLIREGYVIDYENGALFLNPSLAAPKEVTESPRSAGEIPGDNTVIRLEMVETAIEKLSDGTLAIAPETQLAIPEQRSTVLLAAEGSHMGTGGAGIAAGDTPDEEKNAAQNGENN